MPTEFPHTTNCPDCGGMAVCLECNGKRIVEADRIVRMLAANFEGEEEVTFERDDTVIARARMYVATSERAAGRDKP